MFTDIVSIVILPIICGLYLKKILKTASQKLLPIFPSVSIIAIALIVAYVMAATQKKVLAFPVFIILATTITNIVGYLLGILVAKIMRCNKASQGAVMFEYGMQDSGLGVVLATNFFGVEAALSGAFFSVIQNITAAIAVKIMNRKTEKMAKLS